MGGTESRSDGGVGGTGTKTATATATGLGEIILSAFRGVPGAAGGTRGTGPMTAGGSGTVTTKSMTGSVSARASGRKSGPGSGGGSQTTTDLAGSASAGANTNAPASASASAKSTDSAAGALRGDRTRWARLRYGSDGCSCCWDRCVSGLCAYRRAAYVDVRGTTRRGGKASCIYYIFWDLYIGAWYGLGMRSGWGVGLIPKKRRYAMYTYNNMPAFTVS